MMPDRLRRWALVLLPLLAGALLSRFWLHRAALMPASSRVAHAPLLRPFDLMVLLGLMLICALGIRALLPGDEEGQEDLGARDE